MDENKNYTEYTVEKKCTGKYKLQRIMMKIGLWLPMILLGVLGQVISRNPVIWVLVIPIYPIVWLKILKPMFYPYVYIEYEYSVIAGDMKFAEILGKCKRRERLSIKIGDMSAIAPYRDQYKAAADNPNIKNRYYFLSSMDTPEIYYALFKKDDEPAVVFFQPTNKALGILKFHNRETVVDKVSV